MFHLTDLIKYEDDFFFNFQEKKNSEFKCTISFHTAEKLLVKLLAQ